MPRKPSKMPRTGKAVPKPKKNGARKVKKLARKFGGATGKAVSAISKNKAAKRKLLKELG